MIILKWKIFSLASLASGKHSLLFLHRITIILKDTSELQTEISRRRKISPQDDIRPFFQDPGTRGDAILLIFIYDLYFISTFCGRRIHTEAEVVRISCLI